MIAKFYKRKGEDAELIKEFELKPRIEGKDFFRTLAVNVQEVARELLGTDEGVITDTGFYTIRSCGDFWSNFKGREGIIPNEVSRGLCSTTITGKKEYYGDLYTEWKTKPVCVDGVPTDIEVGVECYDTGYLITSSAKATNIVGGKEPVFFEKITPKFFKQGPRSKARLFKTEKDLLRFLKVEKNLKTFMLMHEHKGTCFNFEKASPFWEYEPKLEVIEEIEALFSEINTYEGESEAERRALGNDPKEEALHRMNDLDLWRPVVSDFAKTGKVYMSEFGGVIYDLNEEAEEAVNRTSKYGLPYHVVRTNSPEFGDMYAVLYVSNYPEDWDRDIYDPREGVVFANVYNASMGIDEMGSIGVSPANGGLVRTA